MITYKLLLNVVALFFQAVSFSSFRQSHYERLGVEIIEPLLEQDHFIRNVYVQLGHYGNLSLGLYNWSDLHKALARINDQVNWKAGELSPPLSKADPMSNC